MGIQHRTAIHKTCYIFSWTEELASSIGRLAKRSAVSFNVVEWASGIERLSKRSAVCFHQLTNEHPVSDTYPKDLLYLLWTDEWASGIGRLFERSAVFFMDR